MLSRIVAASLRRGSRRIPAVSPALLGDVLPPLQWDRLFSSGTAEGGEQGTLPPSSRAWKQRKGDDGSAAANSSPRPPLSFPLSPLFVAHLFFT